MMNANEDVVRADRSVAGSSVFKLVLDTCAAESRRSTPTLLDLRDEDEARVGRSRGW